MNKLEKKMRNYSIKKKMLVSIGIIIVAAALIGIILLCGMKYISSNIKGIFKGPMTNISDVADVEYSLNDIQREIVRIVAEGEEKAADNYKDFEAVVEEDIVLLEGAMDSLKERFEDAEGIAKLEELEKKIKEGESVRPKLMTLLKSAELEEAYTLYNKSYRPVVVEIKTLAEELEELIYADGTDYYSGAINISNILMVIGIGLMIFLVLSSVYITRLITRIISEPIDQMEAAAELMFKGDMSAWKLITYESEDELGKVAHSLRGTMKNLNDYVDEISETLREIAKGDLTKDSDEITDFLGDFVSIKESFVYILKNFNKTLTNIQNNSTQVENGAAEISKAANDLSVGATDQASAVQELTATVETVASMATASATQTQTACDNILLAAETAIGERQKMESLIEEMKEIIEISKKIEEITSTIEDIASQTSLLALNASIEAARAGDAGRGFAVVAEQIGKLASDSSASAVSTRELIVKTMEEINKGNEITASVAEAFENTINEMQKFAQVAKETTENANGQAEALSQIESGIEQISSVTQTTAAATEETSAISEQLATRAVELDMLVKEFKLYSDVK